MDYREAVELVQEAIRYRATDTQTLRTAFVHRSYVAEHEGVESYERLEFLGDAVLQLAITDYLMERYATMSEGEMAKVRAAVVNEPVLARLARKFGIPDAMLLGRGEELTGGRDKDSILSDIVESVLGAIYLEAGFAVTTELILHHWSDLVDERAEEPGRRDYKTRLQEELAKEGIIPEYLVTDRGPEHSKEFTAVVTADGEELGAGVGSSKKRAEQEAAKMAFQRHETGEDA